MAVEIDFTTPGWRQISAWCEEELQTLRKKNDDVAMSEAETAANRGEIRCLKKLLSLPLKTATMAKLANPDEDPVSQLL